MLFAVRSLACRRGRHLVFRDIDFALEAGGLLLVTGANGSGKSSLLRVLAGLLPPARGSMLWQGEVIADFGEHRGRLHYIGHLDALKPELTVTEMVDHWRALRGGEAEKNVLGHFGLNTLRDTPIRHLSAGQRRRLALTRLAPDDAPLWLLDEPMTALDGEGQALLLELVAHHRAKGGVAIIATHHDMDFGAAQNLALNGAGR